MDNILKLVCGCLALVGLIVMVIPNSDPLAKTGDAPTIPGMMPTAPADAAAVVAPPPPPAPAAASADSSAPGSTFTVEDYDIKNFGQPMVDPTPPSERKRINDAKANSQQGNQADSSQMNSQPAQSFDPNQPPT